MILHSSQGTIWSHMTLNPRDTPPTRHRLISIKTLIPGSRRVPRAALRWETFFIRELQTSMLLCVALEILCLWTKSDISLAFFSLCLQTESVGEELVLNQWKNGEFNPRPRLCYVSIFSLLAKGKNGDGKQMWGRKVEFISDPGRVICIL